MNVPVSPNSIFSVPFIRMSSENLKWSSSSIHVITPSYVLASKVRLTSVSAPDPIVKASTFMSKDIAAPVLEVIVHTLVGCPPLITSNSICPSSEPDVTSVATTVIRANSSKFPAESANLKDI